MDLNPQQAAEAAGVAAKSPFLVGLLGAVVSLRGAPGITWKERAFNVGSGTMLAGFLSPALTEYFSLTTPAMQSAAAFVVGLFGLNMTAAVAQWIKGVDLNSLVPFGRRKD